MRLAGYSPLLLPATRSTHVSDMRGNVMHNSVRCYSPSHAALARTSSVRPASACPWGSIWVRWSEGSKGPWNSSALPLLQAQARVCGRVRSPEAYTVTVQEVRGARSKRAGAPQSTNRGRELRSTNTRGNTYRYTTEPDRPYSLQLGRLSTKAGNGAIFLRDIGYQSRKGERIG